MTARVLVKSGCVVAPPRGESGKEWARNSSLTWDTSPGGDPTWPNISKAPSGGRGRGEILMFELVSYTQASWFLYHKFQVIGVRPKVGRQYCTTRLSLFYFRTVFWQYTVLHILIGCLPVKNSYYSS